MLPSRLRDPAQPLPDEEAFEAIKAGVDAMPPGVKMLLNSGTCWYYTRLSGPCVVFVNERSLVDATSSRGASVSTHAS